DTKLDLVVGYNNGTVVSVLTNTSSGATPSFTKTDFTVGTSPIGVAVGDFNSDTRPDIAAGNDGSSNVSVLLNTGTPALFPTNNPLTFSTGANSGPTAIAVGDLDGVNGPDIAVADSASGNVSVFLNTGNGSLFPPSPLNFPVGSQPRNLAL